MTESKAKGKKNCKQFGAKDTSLGRETITEGGIREKDSTARTNRRLGAISVDMDTIGVSRKMGGEVRTEDRGRNSSFLGRGEDTRTKRERGGKPRGKT